MRALRAVFVGSTSLVIDCGEAFRSAGHALAHVVTDSSAVQVWACKHAVSCSASAEDQLPRLEEPFDFLFCIDDLAKPLAHWVAAARTLALQLHLTLEPPYTQSHAPSWAVLDQKFFHGVTWRDMRARAGQADVACQLPFGISRLDTAGIVHAKCHEAGLAAFKLMMGDIGTHELHLRASGIPHQPHKAPLPPACGTIDFSRPAHEVVALVSALDFRPLSNDFVRAKILLGPSVALVASAKALSGAASGPPGYVVRVEGETLTIAAADHDVVLTGCVDLSGQPAGHQLAVATCLPQPDEEQLQALATLGPSFTAHEKFWRQTFMDIAPVELPYPRVQGKGKSKDRQTIAATLRAPEQSGEAFDVAAGFYAWLAALTSHETVTVLYTDLVLSRQAAGLEAWLSRWVPLTLTLAQGLNSSQVIDLSRQKIGELDQAGLYLNDLPSRLGLDANSLSRLSKVGLNRCDRVLPANMILMLSVDSQQATLVADAAEFSSDMLQTMASHFSAFMVALTRSTSLSDTQLIPAAEAELLQAFNSTATDYNASTSVPALITTQALQTPDHPAIFHQGTRLTYGELEHRGNALAGQLQRRGVQPGDIVGVCLGRGVEIVVAMLAIFKTGAAYLPLDPDYPQERLRYMVEDSQTRLVLTTTTLASVAGIAPENLCFIDTPDATGPSAFQPLSPSFVPHAAYLMYTSGSTGRPKGVLVTQRGLLNLFAGLRKAIPHEPGGRWLAVTSFSFDISVAELWWPLTLGFTVVIHSSSGAAGASAGQALVDNRITHLFCTPSMVAVLMADSIGQQGLSRLSVLMAGGEVFPLQLTRELCGLVSGKVFNVYGPTEITVLSNICELSEHDQFVPLGPPIANTTIWLKTASGAECPAWVTGELLVGGDGVSDGYWRQPALTSEKFIADPARPGGRLYRTGDLARRRSDGQLEFVGRIDHQVKIRGHRVELGEVEKMLAKVPGVSEAVVLAPEDRFGDRNLVAYVVPHSNARLEPRQLQKAAASALPATMVPAAVHLLQAFPLTANGKIDRRALLALTPGPQQAPAISTENSLEAAIADIWAKALGIDCLGADDDFFSRGGTFSLALRTQPQLQAVTGQLIALSDMVRFSSVRALAQMLAARTSTHQVREAREEVSTLRESQNADLTPPAAISVSQDLTAMESTVANVWRELFAVPMVRKTDDFFALGGTSLTAVRMFASLRRQMSFDLPLAALFEAPQLSDFAALISRSLLPSGETSRGMRLPSSGTSSHLRHRTWSPLVAICRGDARRSALFCIHGAGGNVFNFKALSQVMGQHRTVYGLQPQGVDGYQPVLTSIEAMAAQYVAAIREVDATGPYHLLGYSAGGVIALEMAQQLKKTGARVSLLAMIDTLTPEAALRKLGFFKKLWLLRKWRFEFALERYRQRKSSTHQQGDNLLIEEKLRRGEWLSPELTELHLFNQVLQAQNRYAPGRYEDGILLFKAKDATTQYLQGGHYMGWEAYVEGEIRVFRIPGSHNSMMQGPGLKKIASILNRELLKLDSTDAVVSSFKTNVSRSNERPSQLRKPPSAGPVLASDR